MNFYLCEDGIDYNANNSKCTTKKDIINRIGYNNSLYIKYYYPIIQFQPTNISYPIMVGNKQNNYYISNFTNKIESLFLRQYLLKDDLGWIRKKNINSSYWGFFEINGDSYAKTSERDIINEGSTSIIYSLNLYLKAGIVYYERKYKKIFQIIVEELPIMYVVLVIFKKIAKIIKFSEENKNVFELLFENIREKTNKLEQYKRNIFNKKQKNIDKCKIKSENQFQKSSFCPYPNHDAINSLFKDGSKLKILSPSIIDNNIKTFQINKTESQNPNINKRKKLSRSNQRKSLLENNLIRKIKNDRPINKIGLISNTNYKKTKLFPYKYYFFSVFIKSFDISKLMCCFSKKFVKIYKFLGKMFDISFHLNVIREFHILKNIILGVNDVYKIERPNKINVNDERFIKNINECLNNNNFSIFYQSATKKFN